MNDNEVLEALSRLISGKITAAFTGTVTDVTNAESKAIVKVTHDELTYDVKLKSVNDGKDKHLLFIPKKDSQIFCVSEGNSQERFVAILFNEVDKIIYKGEKTSFMIDDKNDLIQFNTGENGGLAIVEKVNKNLEAIKKYVEAINTAVPSAIRAVGVGSAANGPAGALDYNDAMAGQIIMLEDIENTKIKH